MDIWLVRYVRYKEMNGNLDATIPFVPTIKPSEAEFKDFKTLVYKLSKVETYRKAGCVKVESKGYSSKIIQVQNA